MSQRHGTPPRRIGLVGGECTGKSTLAVALAEALPGCVAPETLRAFVDREGRTPNRDEQTAVMAEQAAAEDEAAVTCPHAVVIADPAPLMTAVYSLQYFGDPSLVDAGADHARGYALVVWCAPDLPWSADGLHRDGPEHRDRTDALIEDVVRSALSTRGIPVLRVSGDTATRVTSVLRAWQP
jgi:nicotinamide riboside kinase